MNIIKIIFNYIFALMFLGFGLNYFFGFLTMPPLEGNAARFMEILASTGFMDVVKIIEILLALLMITGFKRQLAYLLAAPVTVNILMYDIFIAEQLALGIPVFLINLFLLFVYRKKFRCLYS